MSGFTLICSTSAAKGTQKLSIYSARWLRSFTDTNEVQNPVLENL